MTNRLMFIAISGLALAAAPAAAQNAAAPGAAPQGPQPISRAAFGQRIDQAFVSVDANKDGFADRGEIESSEMRALNARKQAVLRQREAAFKQLDKDNNGSLTLAEFNAVVAATPVRADATPMLNKLDTNKDGKVSLAENRAPAMAQFDRADTNKDGSLSVAEQRAAAGIRR